MGTRNQALIHYQFEVRDARGKNFSDDITVLVLSGYAALTVYADAMETALSNPVLPDAFDDMSSRIDFWYAGLNVDLVVTHKNGASVRIENVTSDSGIIVLDFEKSDVGDVITFVDDFFEYDDTATVGNWVVVEDAGATEADKFTDASGGVLQIGCDGDDNDQCIVGSVAEIFKFDTNKKVTFEARIKLTEAATDDANFIIGLSDFIALDALQDDGAGPQASYDGAVFFKVDGGTVFQFETSNAGTQVTTASLATFTSGQWHTVKFEYNPGDGTTGSITPYVDGVAGTAHAITISGLLEMHILMGVKAGGANEEALLVDYVKVTQDRGSNT